MPPVPEEVPPVVTATLPPTMTGKRHATSKKEGVPVVSDAMLEQQEDEAEEPVLVVPKMMLPQEEEEA